MRIHDLFLVASIFTIGCREKRLDELMETCESLNDSVIEIGEECDTYWRYTRDDCENYRSQIEEEGCLKEAEAALECNESVWSSLECDDDIEGEQPVHGFGQRDRTAGEDIQSVVEPDGDH